MPVPGPRLQLQPPPHLQSYRRLPLPVEAVRLTAENTAAVAEWCGGHVSAAGIFMRNSFYPFYVRWAYPPGVYIIDEHGNETLTEGHWVVRSQDPALHAPTFEFVLNSVMHHMFEPA